MRPRSDSSDTNTLSEETIDRPNVAIVPLSLLGKEENGRNIELFTEVAYKNKTEPNDNMQFEKIEFKKGNFTKHSPDTKLKSRRNEVFKCDPCTKLKLG